MAHARAASAARKKGGAAHSIEVEELGAHELRHGASPAADSMPRSSRIRERLRASMLTESIRWRLARVVLVVRPVGLLVSVPLVDHRPAAGDVDQFGNEGRLNPVGPAVHVPVDLLGKAVEQAGHHDLVLAGKEAASLIRDGRDAAANQLELVAARLRTAELSQQPGQSQAILLAWRALTAGLHRKESGDTRNGGGEVVGVVEHDEASRPEAAADRSHRLVADRRVQEGLRDESVGDAGEDGLDPAARPGATADQVDDLP